MAGWLDGWLSLLNPEVRDERLYLTLHCHHQNDYFINIHAAVSAIMGDKVRRQCPQTTTFEERETEREIETDRQTDRQTEPKRTRTDVL